MLCRNRNSKRAASPRWILRSETNVAAQSGDARKDYFSRWRIFERMRRFLRPSFRRPLPDFLVPKAISVFEVDFSPTDDEEHFILTKGGGNSQE
jgi:hypothetical protein